MLEAEMDVTLGYSREEAQSKTTDNSRNGYSKKTVRSELGPIELNIPRDRKGEFGPKIVPKHKRDVSGIEEKVISLYARGLSTSVKAASWCPAVDVVNCPYIDGTSVQT